MEEPKDKRTKAWREWKQNFDEQNSTGVGDVVESITKATGIKKLVETFTPDGKDCGCSKRKEQLNKIRFNHKPIRCFTETQFNQWTDYRNSDKKHEVTKQWQRDVMIPIYLQLFARDLKQPKNCCIKQFITAIDKVYETYV